MAITNYGTLKTAVANWLSRTDLTSRVPELIALAEQRINYGGSDPFPSQPVRIPAMQARETGTISSGSIAFPSDFLEPIRIVASSGGSSWALDYLPPERFTEAENGSDTPGFYTYLNNAIKTAGTGSASYTLDYYAKFTALSNDADENWLLSNAPGVYLYAALIESAPYLYDDARLSTWHSMLKSAIASVNGSTQRKAPGSLTMRVVR